MVLIVFVLLGICMTVIVVRLAAIRGYRSQIVAYLRLRGCRLLAYHSASSPRNGMGYQPMRYEITYANAVGSIYRAIAVCGSSVHLSDIRLISSGGLQKPRVRTLGGATRSKTLIAHPRPAAKSQIIRAIPAHSRPLPKPPVSLANAQKDEPVSSSSSLPLSTPPRLSPLPSLSRPPERSPLLSLRASRTSLVSERERLMQRIAEIDTLLQDNTSTP